MAATPERWTPAGPIRSQAPLEIIEQEETHAAASVGDPAPLGLFAVATGPFTLGPILAGWFPLSTLLFASAVTFVFAGLGQFLAGMWAYRKGDTFAATAFGSFGGFNASYVLYPWLRQAGLIAGPGAGAGVVGVSIACFSFIALALTIAALRQNLALVAVLGLLALGYGLLAAGAIAAGAPALRAAGGWALIGSAVVAFYAGAALVINSPLG